MNELSNLSWYWRFLIISGIIAWGFILLNIYWYITVKISDYKDARKRDYDAERLKLMNKDKML